MLKDELEKDRQKSFEKKAEEIIKMVKKKNKEGKNSIFLRDKCLEEEVVNILKNEGLKVSVTSSSARGESIRTTFISW